MGEYENGHCGARIDARQKDIFVRKELLTATVATMLMIIVGAGASYDSVNTDLDPDLGTSHRAFQPPLASGLFAPRQPFKEALGRFGEATPLVSRLRRDVDERKDVEVSLRGIAQEAENDPRRGPQLLALQCYLRVIVGVCGEKWAAAASHVTHYRELADAIEHWRSVNQPGAPVYYVTFNYDTMLDDALAHTYPQLDLSNMASYTTRMDVQLFKPHGSVNWVHPTNVATSNTDEAALLLFSSYGSYEVDRQAWLTVPGTGAYDKWTVGGEAVVPALAIPVRAKTEFELPPNHMRALKEAISKTTTVLTIGWRGQEQHFLDLWSEDKRPVSVMCVSGSRTSGEKIFETLKSSNMLNRRPVRRVESSDGGFRSVCGSPELATLLASVHKAPA